MFRLFSTLIQTIGMRPGATAAHHAAQDLLHRRIREAEAGMTGARQVLAGLVLRRRGEQQQVEAILIRRASTEERARNALAEGDEARAAELAHEIAEMENAVLARQRTILRVDSKISALHQALGKARQHVMALRHNAAAIRHGEASLPGEISGQDDPFGAEPLTEAIARSLCGRQIGSHPATADPGPPAEIRSDEVLARLRIVPSHAPYLDP